MISGTDLSSSVSFTQKFTIAWNSESSNLKTSETVWIIAIRCSENERSAAINSNKRTRTITFCFCVSVLLIFLHIPKVRTESFTEVNFFT